MPASLRDVAERAGVARATVSTVLNNRAAEIRISVETQARIRRIAEELGYRPNRLAQGLGKGRTNIIGLMIAGLRNPFFLSLMEIAEERAFKAGYDVLTDAAFQLRASYATKGKLSGWPVDGFLIWVLPDKELSDFMGATPVGLPVVYLGYPRSDASDFVAIDREIGVRQAMEHLVSLGHRRIAYLYPWDDGQSVDVRYTSYVSLCTELGLESERLRLEPQGQLALISQAGLREAGLATGVALAKKSPEDRPDAIICHNDLVAIGLYHGLKRGGLSVPKDLAIVGFDGIEEGQCLDRPLTTVVSPGEQMIETALDILTQRLKTPSADQLPPQQITLNSVLRIGETT